MAHNGWLEHVRSRCGLEFYLILACKAPELIKRTIMPHLSHLRLPSKCCDPQEHCLDFQTLDQFLGASELKFPPKLRSPPDLLGPGL